MKLSGGILLAICFLLVKECNEYGNLTKRTTWIMSLTLNPKIEQIEISKCTTTVDLIVGGQDAKPGEFPHFALLGWIMKDDPVEYNFKCGGTLISDRFVLTAAHCFKKSKPNIVRLGANDLSNENENFVDRNVEQAFAHPSYHAKRSYHDIALVKLAKPVQLSVDIRPACLWTEPEINVTSVIANGFGLTEQSGVPSNILQKVTLDVLTKADCAHLSRNSPKFFRGIADEQLCIGSFDEAKDTCTGDSGGPVQVVRDSKGCVYHVLGVTSLGSACGIGRSSAIYTFVEPYIRWIEQNVWGQ